VSHDCQVDYQVKPQDANVELGIVCLKKMIEQLRFNICRLEDSRLANADVKDLPTRIKENISDTLQYSSLHWSNHLCFTPDTGDRRVWKSLREFFEGPFALFWIEVLSIMGMLRIGVPSLRKVTSTLVKVSTAPICCHGHPKVIRNCCRTPIRDFWKEFRMFAVSWSSSALPSLSALHTPMFQRDYSCPQSHLYQPSSANILLTASRYKQENCCHGQRHHWNGLGTRIL